MLCSRRACYDFPCCACTACADDVVEERKLAKSLNCGKTFRGRHSLRDLASVHTWLLELGGCGVWAWVPAGAGCPCPCPALPCRFLALPFPCPCPCLALLSPSTALPALNCPGGELSERLQEDREANNRVPQLLTVTISTQLPWAAGQQGAAQAGHGGLRGWALPACKPQLRQLLCRRLCRSSA